MLDGPEVKCDPLGTDLMSFERVDAGSELGPYRVTKRVASRERALFLAVGKASESVCLLELRADEVPALAPAKNIQHAHLARVHEILETDGPPLLVFDAVAGATLTERLQELGKKPTFAAVGTALRVSDALSHLHEVGAVHGFLHTDSVFVDPPERLGPILAFSPLPSDERTFHSPERGATGKPSVADDAWAVAGLLHQMLTGAPPPKAGYSTTEELAAAGVADKQLQTALLHGLHRDPATRSKDVRPLRRELARWFVEHAGEELFVQSEHSSHPPPLPPSSQAPSTTIGLSRSSATPPPPSAGKQRLVWLSAIGMLVGLGGTWALSQWLGRPQITVVEQPAAREEPTAASIDLSEVPVTGVEHTVELGKEASCVASYLPKGAFGRSPELGWLCEENNSLKGAKKLRHAIVAGAAKPNDPTDAMKLISRMGHYDMAAHAVIRAGCCIDAKPLTVFDPSPGCESLSELLSSIGRDVVSSEPVDETLGRYEEAIRCEFSKGRGAMLGRDAPPKADEGKAFRELLQSIAH